MLAGKRGMIREGVERSGRYAAIALGFSIPVSVALDGALLAVVLLAYLATGRFRDKAAAIASNPVVGAALLLYGALLLGTLYGPADLREAGRYLSKYADLLCIPALAFFFSDARSRQLGLYAFGAAVALTVLLSFLIALGWVPAEPFKAHDYPAVFKYQLTHSWLAVLGALLFALLARYAASAGLRATFVLLAALAAVNAVFFVPGRTAYVVLLALALYCAWAWRGWRGLAWALPATAVMAAAAFGVSDVVRERVETAIREYRAADAAVVSDRISSIGVRLEFYRNSLAIVRDHPVAGVGTGGFVKAYEDKVRGTGMPAILNPHNEYLLIAAQLGAIGLALFLHLLWRQWRLAPRLAAPLETHLARGLVIAFALGCLFNSFLLDHTEGLLYAWMTALLSGGLQSRQ